MLFGIEDLKNPIIVDIPKHFGDQQYYSFNNIKQVSEAEMFRNYKKRLFIQESKRRISNDALDALASMAKKFNPAINTSSQNHVPISRIKNYTYNNYYIGGSFIISKLYGYFPFLDCDDSNTYEEAKFNLSMDNVPYVAFKSNMEKDSYWIFCDRQGELDETIDFIESYPCDHRYAWISRHKKELCIRAIPKRSGIPMFDENFLVDDFTKDFTFWIDRFTDYWTDGLIPSYIDMVQTADVI